MSTALAQQIAREIAASAPMRIDQFMQRCLLDPKHGYYTTREPFGQQGDFITAPEISQMFGELLGLALAKAWLDQGQPSPFILCEIGPGRGTLMADLLRATRAVPGFLSGAEIWLVEPSPRLRAVQTERLAGFALHHADRLEAVPEGPLFLIANEAFDALPIRQFHAEPTGLRERMVALDEAGALRFALSAPLETPPSGLNAVAGKTVEICPEGQRLAALIGERLCHQGAAYVIDYGGEGGVGDTLQALYQGQPDDPLAHPGEADLTAHVDFAALARAAQAAGARAQGPAPQGDVLHRLGIGPRAEILARHNAAEKIQADYQRLTHPDQMGHLFKVLALSPPDTPLLPGMP